MVLLCYGLWVCQEELPPSSGSLIRVVCILQLLYLQSHSLPLCFSHSWQWLTLDHVFPVDCALCMSWCSSSFYSLNMQGLLGHFLG